MFTPREKTDYRCPVFAPFPKSKNRPPKPKPVPQKSPRSTKISLRVPLTVPTQDSRRRKQRFLGPESEIEEHTYTLGNNQRERFVATTKAISNHVGRTYKNGGDVKRSIDQLRGTIIPPPADLLEAIEELPADPGGLSRRTTYTTTPLIPATQGPSKTQERIW